MASHEDSSQDQTWRNSRREAIRILAVGAFFLVWTIGYSYAYGYGNEADIKLVFGIPSWAFWGVVVPWCLATLVSIVFAFCLISDDPLEPSSDSNDQGDTSRA